VSRGLAALTLAAGMALSAAALAPLTVAAQDATVTTVSDDLGTYLVGPDGRTLYYFTVDTAPGVSACDADCLANWPLLTVPEGQAPVAGAGVTGVLGAVPMGDGNAMVTYDGRPLYYFAGDAAAGETNGQGRGEVWYVALEDGSVPASGEAAGEVGLTLGTATSDLGTFLTGVDGKTLYFFTVDAVPGVSMCDEASGCITNWPALSVAEGQTIAAPEGVSGVVGMTTTPDGQPIATWNGRPLYYFVGDEAAGDTKGQGLGEVWFVALTDGSIPAPMAEEPMASPMAEEPMASPTS
jgi:predicted lipoprotein with Yx(FWY)xxD motif